MSCTYRNSYFETDAFFVTVLHTLSFIQIPLHILGAYIIIAKTPKTMERVKYPMLLLHLTCASFDVLLTIFLVPVVIFPVCAGYTMGLFRNYGVPVWIQGYVGFTVLFCLGPAVVMFFENRYNHLIRRDSETFLRKVKRGIHYFINYFVTFFTLLPGFHDGYKPRDSKSVALQKLPCLPSVIVDNPNFYLLGNEFLILVFITIFLVSHWIQATFFFVKLSTFIFRTKAQSRRTNDLQKKFFLAISAQVALPFVIVTIPSAYLLSTLASKHYDILACNMCVAWVTTHGLFSTLIMLCVHKPYRVETLKLLKISKWNIVCKGERRDNGSISN